MLFADIDWPIAKDIVLGVVAGVVAISVPLLSYLSIRNKSKDANLEDRVKVLEAHVKDCIEVMDSPWPSDDMKGRPFADRVSEAREFAAANGLEWKFKDVVALSKKYIREKLDMAKKPSPPPPQPDQGGHYS
jgi:hypothetical protein